MATKHRTPTVAEQAALAEAARLLGGQAALALACGYGDRRNVWPWFNRGYQVPAVCCPLIELATGGQVRAEALRSDVAWARVPDADWPVGDGRPCIDPANAPARRHEFSDR